MEFSLSHIAILVPSVRKTAELLSRQGFEIGEEESFEETKEIYIQGNAHNSLLLMEAKETGSYRRAMEKRGPGIHHIAIDVLDLDVYLKSLSGSGWLLHLKSLEHIKNIRTAYLARPGFPALIEVQEKKHLGSGPLFVENLKLKFEPNLKNLINSIQLDNFVQRTEGSASLKIKGQTFLIHDLF